MTLPRDEWEAMWATIDPQQATDLMGYAALVDRAKHQWTERYPTLSAAELSNARYEVHLEHALARGETVPDAFIATVTDHDLRYDAYCFPLLVARRNRLAQAEPAKA